MPSFLVVRDGIWGSKISGDAQRLSLACHPCQEGTRIDESARIDRKIISRWQNPDSDTYPCHQSRGSDGSVEIMSAKGTYQLRLNFHLLFSKGSCPTSRGKFHFLVLLHFS